MGKSIVLVIGSDLSANCGTFRGLYIHSLSSYNCILNSVFLAREAAINTMCLSSRCSIFIARHHERHPLNASPRHPSTGTHRRPLTRVSIETMLGITVQHLPSLSAMAFHTF